MTNDKEQPIIENAGKMKNGHPQRKKGGFICNNNAFCLSELDGPQPPKKLKSGCSGQLTWGTVMLYEDLLRECF